jgi:hypothetical protein
MASHGGNGPATTKERSAGRRYAAAIVVACLSATGVAAVPAPAAVDAVGCRAALPRHVVVTTVRNMPCARAVSDLTGYRRAFAVSFRTPGGFTCVRAFRRARGSGFRCAAGARAYRFRFSGFVRPAVRVLGGAFDGTLTVSRCRMRGAGAVVLAARAPGVRLTLRAAPGRPGTLRLTSHDPENEIDAAGSVASLRLTRGGSVAAAGRFESGGTAAFRVVGDCR